jgi:hypothetical protein
MTGLVTARALRSTGLGWDPVRGDRFVIPDRDMDADVFVLSDMTIEAHEFPTGRVLGFNGTTEWALDSVGAEQAVWLPHEGQLRALLGEAFVRLERRGRAWAVTTERPAGPHTPLHATAHTGLDAAVRTTLHATVDPDVEEAYALALLAVRARTALQLLPVAVHDLRVRLHALDAPAWGLQVAVRGGSLRDLALRSAAEQRSVVDLLAGRTVDPAGSPPRRGEEAAAADPAAVWDDAVRTSLAAWVAADPGGPVPLVTGPVTVAEYAEQALLDLVLAAWDVARASRQDEHLDPAAVRHVLAHLRPRAAQWSEVGVLAPPVDLGAPGAADDPDEQEELLALTGRDPR